MLLLIPFAIGYKIWLTPSTIIPYPYQFQNIVYPDWQDAANSHVLILGDRAARGLTPYHELITTLASEGLRSPLEIFNWSRESEGIHRTVEKVRFLAKQNALPRVVVYMGGSSEFEEKRFYYQDLARIKINFALFQNERISSAIMLWPALSRLIYLPTTRVELTSAANRSTPHYTGKQWQEVKEVAFKLYRYHLEEMGRIIRAHNSQLILVTTPVNLEHPPRRSCPHTESREISQKQGEILELFKQGRHKDAFIKAQKLSDISIANAHSSFLLGRAALEIGELSTARRALLHAVAVDCDQWQMNPVFNSLIIQNASRHDHFIIDFDRLLNLQLGQNVLFLDARTPQNLFYQQFSDILAREIRKIYQL